MFVVATGRQFNEVVIAAARTFEDFDRKGADVAKRSHITVQVDIDDDDVIGGKLQDTYYVIFVTQTLHVS